MVLIDCLLTHLILFAVFFCRSQVVKVLLDLKFSATERERERESAPQVSTLVYTPLLVDLGRCSTPGRVENHFLKKKERKKAIK